MLTRLWAARGSRPRVQRDRRFTWAYPFGAICPAQETGAANSVWETYEAIVHARCDAWRGLIATPEVITSIRTAGIRSGPEGPE